MNKELEALERLVDDVLDIRHYYKQFSSSTPIIMQDKQLIEEGLKALEIIKEKYVIPSFIANSESVEEYNRQLKQITFRKDYEIRKLTKEEYDILKEILK